MQHFQRPFTASFYVFEADKTSGTADAIVLDLGQTVFRASHVNPGTYYMRVRSRNVCGTGDASNEVVVVVP